MHTAVYYTIFSFDETSLQFRATSERDVIKKVAQKKIVFRRNSF